MSSKFSIKYLDLKQKSFKKISFHKLVNRNLGFEPINNFYFVNFNRFFDYFKFNQRKSFCKVFNLKKLNDLKKLSKNILIQSSQNRRKDKTIF